MQVKFFHQNKVLRRKVVKYQKTHQHFHKVRCIFHLGLILCSKFFRQILSTYAGEREGETDFPSFLAFRAQIFGSKEICSIGLANVS